MSDKKIYILTGAIQSGKTTKLKEWCNDKKDVFGILTPVIDGKRFFLDISPKEKFQMEAESNEKDVFTIGKFVFRKRSFEKAITILSNALQEKNGWIIVDEIGP